MAIDAQQTTLPGFETIAPVLAKADSFRSLVDTDYTAEELYLKHRERYEIAAFLTGCGLGLSDRFVCKACKLNSRTLKAIKMREDGKESAAVLFRKRVKGFAKVISFRVLQETFERLNDPESVASLSISDLKKAKELADEFARESSGEQHDETIVDVDADVFDDAISDNGLDARKKRAGEEDGASQVPGDGPTVDASVPGCSAGNGKAMVDIVNEQQYPENARGN